jgi:hemerythrin superfamily protein
MSTSKTRKRTNGNDAIQLLREDHRTLEKLFTEFEKTDDEDPATCRDIVERTCTKLKIHAAVEEELFYPALREAFGEDDASLIDEAEVEHDTAKMLIARLESLEAEDPHYAATFTVLAEYTRHHVKEEENEIFPKAKKAKLDLEDLGARMRARTDELTEEMGGAETAETATAD